jgi:hypothetical protein
VAARVALVALLLWLAPSQPTAPIRVLFIGNSLTYVNDLPAMVAAFGRSAGTPIEYDAVAVPDFSLEDHWNQGRARAAIRRGGWAWVVLQQGPSALPTSRVLLIEYAKRFDQEIRRAGARTAMYMVWPSRARRGDFPGVSRSYAAAATELRATLLPVGDAWQEAWAIDASLPLYGRDGLHPSPMGSWLASLVIYRQLTGREAPSEPVSGASAVHASQLRRAAAAAVAKLSGQR